MIGAPRELPILQSKICWLDGEAGAGAGLVVDAPGHVGGVVGEAVAAVGAEEDDAAVAA